MSLLRLDALGVPRGEAIVVTRERARVLEIAAAADKSRLSVVWAKEDGRMAQVVASTGELTTGAFAPPKTVGMFRIESAARRGNLALSGRAGAAPLVFARAADVQCADRGTLPCTGFGFHALEPGGPVTRGLPLSVPAACDVGVGGLVVGEERWHYGVCALHDGRRMTTVFGIQPEREYARADEVLRGCIPLGMTRLGRDVIAGGDCAGEWRGARFRAGDGPPQPIEVELEIACERGSAVVRSGASDVFRAPLDAPLDHAEALLGPRQFGSGSRAIWTGRALLVASPDGKSVRLRRDECRGDVLVTTGVT